MPSPKKILVAYDGSPHSKAALGWAVLLGKTVNAELDVIKVFEPIHHSLLKLDRDYDGRITERFAELEEEDHQLLENAKFFCRESGLMKVQTALLKGNAAPTLLDYAAQGGIDLIVSGTKGHGTLNEMLVGSVTNSLVSLSKLPVLVVKEEQAPYQLQKILVAYDGSDFSKAALDLALDLGKSSGARLTVVKVNDPLDFLLLSSMAGTRVAVKLAAQIAELDEADRKLLAEAKAAAANREMEIVTDLLSGVNIADTLIRYAEENHVDMTVAGTLGHGLLGGLLLGSVTRQLISLSKNPVLVVKK